MNKMVTYSVDSDFEIELDQNTSITVVIGNIGPAGPAGPTGPVGPAGSPGSPDTASQVLTKMLTVDGPGSLLNSDLLDNEHGHFYRNVSNMDAGNLPMGRMPLIPPATILGNVSASSSVPNALTVAQSQAMLSVVENTVTEATTSANVTATGRMTPRRVGNSIQAYPFQVLTGGSSRTTVDRFKDGVSLLDTSLVFDTSAAASANTGKLRDLIEDTANDRRRLLMHDPTKVLWVFDRVHARPTRDSVWDMVPGFTIKGYQLTAAQRIPPAPDYVPAAGSNFEVMRIHGQDGPGGYIRLSGNFPTVDNSLRMSSYALADAGVTNNAAGTGWVIHEVQDSAISNLSTVGDPAMNITHGQTSDSGCSVVNCDRVTFYSPNMKYQSDAGMYMNGGAGGSSPKHGGIKIISPFIHRCQKGIQVKREGQRYEIIGADICECAMGIGIWSAQDDEDLNPSDVTVLGGHVRKVSARGLSLHGASRVVVRGLVIEDFGFDNMNTANGDPFGSIAGVLIQGSIGADIDVGIRQVEWSGSSRALNPVQVREYVSGTAVGTTTSKRNVVRARISNYTHASSIGYREIDASTTDNAVDLFCFNVTTYSDVDPATSSTRVSVTDPVNGVWLEKGITTGFDSVTVPSLSDGTGYTTAAVPITGAGIGDYVGVSFNHDLQGVLLTGWVSSGGNVMARFHNGTGGTISLGAGTLRVRVLKK